MPAALFGRPTADPDPYLLREQNPQPQLTELGTASVIATTSPRIRELELPLLRQPALGTPAVEFILTAAPVDNRLPPIVRFSILSCGLSDFIHVGGRRSGNNRMSP
jgi:hypothetical protein